MLCYWVFSWVCVCRCFVYGADVLFMVLNGVCCGCICFVYGVKMECVVDSVFVLVLCGVDVVSGGICVLGG